MARVWWWMQSFPKKKTKTHNQSNTTTTSSSILFPIVLLLLLLLVLYWACVCGCPEIAHCCIMWKGRIYGANHHRPPDKVWVRVMMLMLLLLLFFFFFPLSQSLFIVVVIVIVGDDDVEHDAATRLMPSHASWRWWSRLIPHHHPITTLTMTINIHSLCIYSCYWCWCCSSSW